MACKAPGKGKDGFFDTDFSRSGFWTQQPTECDEGMFERAGKEVDPQLQDVEAWNRVEDQSDPFVIKQLSLFC